MFLSRLFAIALAVREKSWGVIDRWEVERVAMWASVRGWLEGVCLLVRRRCAAMLLKPHFDWDPSSGRFLREERRQKASRA